MKKAIIIQARLGSTRMPGKILLPFYHNETILSIIVKRLIAAFPDVPVVVATSVDSSNDPLEREAIRLGAFCYRGDENDVLSRFIGASEMVGAEAIIRVCSDNPFLSDEAISRLLQNLTSESYNPDYVGFWVNNHPNILTHHGFYAEGVKVEALKRVAEMTSEKLYHEHVTNFIYTHPDNFRLLWLDPDPALIGREDIRLTIDTPDDFNSARRIYSELTDSSTPLTISNVVAHIDAADSDLIASMTRQIDKNSK